MITEPPDAGPATIAEASLRLQEAQRGLDMCARSYARARDAGRRAGTVRERAEWHVALLDWVSACTAHAAAVDRKWAARHGAPPQEPPPPSDEPLHAADLATARRGLDDLARAYDWARRTSGADMATAHAAWAQALTQWALTLIAARTAEDDATAEAGLDAMGPAMKLGTPTRRWADRR